MSDVATFWNQRFASPEYAYGDAPNDFLRQQAGRLPPGSKVLSLGEGEGRNAVYLAGLGHQLTAVDAAWTGLAKLLQRADAAGLAVTASLADLEQYDQGEAQWDAIVSVFCHLPTPLRRQVLAAAVRALKPGGLLIMEGYTPRQLAFGTGGPKDVDMLLEPAIVQDELAGLELLQFAETERKVIEGSFHTGRSAVLQVVARKP
ncbi:class I SAM-dependent methyltransferase [Vogesella oryzae]|uniref:class I SAM-dependent methyltransferase n=1 Tax=Vogesella oryzae TaxID=1735285 RepID=UPI001582C822|nr:class I SAM-dependent methyltransferase [Vogesella oryzae]